MRGVAMIKKSHWLLDVSRLAVYGLFAYAGHDISHIKLYLQTKIYITVGIFKF